MVPSGVFNWVGFLFSCWMNLEGWGMHKTKTKMCRNKIKCMETVKLKKIVEFRKMNACVNNFHHQLLQKNCFSLKWT